MLVKTAEELLDQTDLSLYREENPQVFLLIRCFASYWMAAIFLLLAILLVAGMIALQDRKVRCLIYLGVDMFLIGVANLATGIVTNSLVSLLNRSVGLGRSFWRALFSPVQWRGMIQGGVFVAVGVVFCLVYILTNVMRRKK